MQAMSVIEIKQRCTQLTLWIGFYAGNFSAENQLYNLPITSYRQYSDIILLSIQFLPLLP